MPERANPRIPNVAVAHERISSPNNKDDHAKNPFPKPRTLLYKMTKLPVIRKAFKFAHRTFLPRVSPELALACTIVLSRLCVRAGKLIADKRIALEAAERMCLSMVLRGSRALMVSGRGQALGGTQGLEAA